jgi:predicted transcriptional regulator
MQTLQQQQASRIEETERKDDLLEILSDKYCRSILESIMHKPKSVIEITSETNIPMSTVYRRVQTLHDSKLLAVSGMITSEGKKLFLYKSKIKEMKSTFDNGQIEVEIIFNN